LNGAVYKMGRTQIEIRTRGRIAMVNKYFPQLILVFVFMLHLTQLNAAQYALPVRATDPRQDSTVGHSGGPLEGPNKTRNEWSVLLYSSSDRTTLEPLSGADVKDEGLSISMLKSLYVAHPFIFYRVANASGMRRYAVRGNAGRYVTLQFLHDATAEEIKKESGKAIAPELLAFIKNEEHWKTIVTTFNNLRQDSSRPDQIKQLTLMKGAPAPVGAARVATLLPGGDMRPVDTGYALLMQATSRRLIGQYNLMVSEESDAHIVEWTVLLYPSENKLTFVSLTNAEVQYEAKDRNSPDNMKLTEFYVVSPYTLYFVSFASGMDLYKDRATRNFGTYISLQFLHDATAEEIAEKAGKAVDPALLSLIKNEEQWNILVSMLSKQVKGQFMPDDIKKLTLAKIGSEPIAIAPLLRTVDNDLRVLVGKVL